MSHSKEPKRSRKTLPTTLVLGKAKCARSEYVERVTSTTMSEPVIIMILGSSHSGTTILKSIIGRAQRCSEAVGELRSSNISDYILEAKQASKELKCDYIVVKRPPSGLSLPREHLSPGWKKVIRILITRNPVMVCNSWNERRVPYRNCTTRFKRLENIVAAITVRENDPRTYYIRYEDLFTNNFLKIREIIDDIGLKYDDSIFDTKDRGVISHRNLKVNSSSRPDPVDHELYRTWQINQPFKNFDDDRTELILTSKQKEWLTDNSILEQLYPGIPEILQSAKTLK